MFTAALFKTAKIWRQPKCHPSTEKGIKVWYIHSLEYFFFKAIKKNEMLLFTTIWIDGGYYAY